MCTQGVKFIQQQRVELKRKFVMGDYMKIAIWWEGMTLLIGEHVNLLRKIFVVAGMRKFLGDGWDSPPISRVSYKGLGERGAVHSCWGQQINIKEGDIFG